MKTFNIAVVGATGLVGSEVISILEERKFPVGEFFPLASSASKNKEVLFNESVYYIKDLNNFDFSSADIVISCVSSDIIKNIYKKILDSKCVLIDNSSAFRNKNDIPLIVSEVNSDIIENNNLKGTTISNPNCSTIQLCVALNELHKKYKIKNIIGSTYQACSGAGNVAMDELFSQSRNLIVGQDLEGTKNYFGERIAFSLIPKIGDFSDNGNTAEEEKMQNEIQKIFNHKINSDFTCVRVPVFNCHSISATVEFEEPVSELKALRTLQNTRGVTVYDDNERNLYAKPDETNGEDSVYISRIRQSNTFKNGINFWCVADNLRKGAALNAVQIAELIIK